MTRTVSLALGLVVSLAVLVVGSAGSVVLAAVLGIVAAGIHAGTAILIPPRPACPPRRTPAAHGVSPPGAQRAGRPSHTTRGGRPRLPARQAGHGSAQTVYAPGRASLPASTLVMPTVEVTR